MDAEREVMTIKQILRKSKALIQQGWVKGEPQRECNGTVCYCTTGAVDAVVGVRNELYDRTINLLGDVIRPVRDGYGNRRHLIQEWNDAEHRRKHDVLKAFDRAIARAESLNA